MTTHERGMAGGVAASTTAGALLWERSAKTKPGPKPRYSLDGIADAAIAIADDDGLDAVTMQRVAARLGTTKMALYRYVTGRADLDAVMLDRALGMPPSLTGPDWRPTLATWADSIYQRTLGRPWSVELTQRPHTPGPAELAWFEAGLDVMAELPLDGGEKLDLLALLVGHVMSIVRRHSETSEPEEALATGLAPILAAHAEAYPHTAAAFAESSRGASRDDALRFGVDRVLAGLSALVAERTGSH